MLAAEWATGQVVWSMMYFFLFVIWIWMLVAIFSDIFRSDDLSGWGKALWSIFVMFLPFLGVFTYLIARGKRMGEREAQRAYRQEQMLGSYVREVAEPTEVDQLSRLATLRAEGVIDDGEFLRMKARLTAA